MENTKVPPDLLLNFFLTFSKFEFALKTYAFSRGGEKGVLPDWDKFASSIKKSFDKSQSDNLTEAINYFLDNPPWKQVLINGVMFWDTALPSNGLSEIEKALILIRRVRNNLFHGGKHNLEVHEHTERTILLLEYNLIILDACLGLSPEVNDNFLKATI